MDPSIGSAREWYYRDDASGTQRGPVPSTLLCKLLEKGIGVNGSTVVWKQGMESWLSMSQVQQFQSIIEFNGKQWYYLDSDRNQQGPIISRMLIHKLKQQEIDGMTLVFGGGLTEWKQVSEVPELKNEMIKINQEEQAAEEAAAAAAAASQEEFQHQIFSSNTDDDIIPPYSMPAKADTKESTAVAAAPATKKSFIADDGVRYGWDEEEQDWVEMDEDELMEEEEQPEDRNSDDSDNEGVASANGSSKKRKLGETGTTSEGKPSGSDTATATDADAATAAAAAAAAKKKKRGKRKPKKAPNTWIYVTGLPANVTFEEIKDHFSKVGLISLSPYDQQPYIKIYRDEAGQCKGDCSLCYNAEESVNTAVEFLNDGYIRPTHQITVKRADFTSRGSGEHSTTTSAVESSAGGPRKPASAAQRKVAKSAIQQALTWNDEEDVGIKHSAALRIVVLENMFSPEELQGPQGEQFEKELEQDIASGCEQCGEIDKMTIFSKNPKGVVIVKFSTSFGAQECVKLMNGRFFGGRKISCTFWDGVTNHSLSGGSSGVTTQQLEEAEKEEQERLDEFGDWLDQEQEDLPEEFRLRTE